MSLEILNDLEDLFSVYLIVNFAYSKTKDKKIKFYLKEVMASCYASFICIFDDFERSLKNGS